jgi:carbonic anhydrase
MDDAIARLVTGYRRFRAGHFEQSKDLYQRLIREGQSPQVMIVACCDARVDPAVITGSGPGELFITRNVANLVPPCETAGHYHGTSAALEFAVRCLEVRHIIVLGHARCGGIRALLKGFAEGSGAGQFIQPWMTIAGEARREALALAPDPSSEAAWRACEEAAIRISLRNLHTFPWVRERVEQGRLALHGWYFDIASGELLRSSPDDGKFRPLSDATTA